VVPASRSVTAANKADIDPAGTIVWKLILADRIDALAGGEHLTAMVHDGSAATVNGEGKQIRAAPVRVATPPLTAEQRQSFAIDGRILKTVAEHAGHVAVGYWGGYLRVLTADGVVVLARQFQHDIGGLAWVGARLVVGLSDGSLVALSW
jgi:hypothetical protein